MLDFSRNATLSPILLMVFKDRIRGSDGFGIFARLQILLFYLVSLNQVLQCIMMRFAVECEMAEIKIHTSKWKDMKIGGELLPQVEKLKYLGIFLIYWSIYTYTHL